MLTTVDNKLGHRNRYNAIYVAIMDKESVIVKFDGHNIPGILTVVHEDYVKNGKWSYSQWTVDTPDNVKVFEMRQSFGTGAWFDAKTWEAAIHHVQNIIGLPLPPLAVERFIRVHFPKSTLLFDAADEAKTVNPSYVVSGLIDSQNAVIQTAKMRSELQHTWDSMLAQVKEVEDNKKRAEENRLAAEKLSAAILSAKDKMKHGCSLADLQELMK